MASANFKIQATDGTLSVENPGLSGSIRRKKPLKGNKNGGGERGKVEKGILKSFSQ